MTKVQIAETGEDPPWATWDAECDQWVAFDINHQPHWDSIREESVAKAIEANNVYIEHIAKCPSDEVLLAWDRHWADDPRNFKCNGIY